jgi:hypothetical protein
MLSVIMLSVTYKHFVPSVVMMNVIMLSAVAPQRQLKNVCKIFNPFS